MTEPLDMAEWIKHTDKPASAAEIEADLDIQKASPIEPVRGYASYAVVLDNGRSGSICIALFLHVGDALAFASTLGGHFRVIELRCDLRVDVIGKALERQS